MHGRLFLRPGAVLRQLAWAIGAGALGGCLILLIEESLELVFAYTAGSLVVTVVFALATSVSWDDEEIRYRRGFQLWSRRWVDLAVDPQERRLCFSVQRVEQDSDVLASWTRFAPDDFEARWREGRLGAQVRRKNPRLWEQLT